MMAIGHITLFIIYHSTYVILNLPSWEFRGFLKMNLGPDFQKILGKILSLA